MIDSFTKAAQSNIDSKDASLKKELLAACQHTVDELAAEAEYDKSLLVPVKQLNKAIEDAKKSVEGFADELKGQINAEVTLLNNQIDSAIDNLKSEIKTDGESAAEEALNEALADGGLINKAINDAKDQLIGSADDNHNSLAELNEEINKLLNTYTKSETEDFLGQESNIQKKINDLAERLKNLVKFDTKVYYGTAPGIKVGGTNQFATFEDYIKSCVTDNVYTPMNAYGQIGNEYQFTVAETSRFLILLVPESKELVKAESISGNYPFTDSLINYGNITYNDSPFILYYADMKANIYNNTFKITSK